LGHQAVLKPKYSKIFKANLGCIRHAYNEFLAVIDIGIELFYLCIFSRKRSWSGQGEASKKEGELLKVCAQLTFFLF